MSLPTARRPLGRAATLISAAFAVAKHSLGRAAIGLVWLTLAVLIGVALAAVLWFTLVFLPL